MLRIGESKDDCEYMRTTYINIQCEECGYIQHNVRIQVEGDDWDFWNRTLPDHKCGDCWLSTNDFRRGDGYW